MINDTKEQVHLHCSFYLSTEVHLRVKQQNTKQKSERNEK